MELGRPEDKAKESKDGWEFKFDAWRDKAEELVDKLARLFDDSGARNGQLPR